MQARELVRRKHMKWPKKSLITLGVSERCSIAIFDRVNVYFTVEVLEVNSLNYAIGSLEAKLPSSDIEHLPIRFRFTCYFKYFCDTLSFFFSLNKS